AASGRQPEREVLLRERIHNIAAFLAQPPSRLPGLALSLVGPGAAPRFAPEQGLHIVRGPRHPQPLACLVESSDGGWAAYLPPVGITRRGAIGTQPRRRTYDRGQEALDDAQLEAKVPWEDALSDALAEAIRQGLRRRMLALLEE